MEQQTDKTLFEPSIDKTAEQIEAVKSAYVTNKTKLFGLMQARRSLTPGEQGDMRQFLLDTLEQVRWLLEVISTKVEEQDQKQRMVLYSYFTNYPLDSEKGEELFIKLREFDVFVGPYIDNWRHAEAML